MVDGRNFYDQPIDQLKKQYNEVRRVSTGKGNGYTKGCFLDYGNLFRGKEYTFHCLDKILKEN